MENLIFALLNDSTTLTLMLILIIESTITFHVSSNGYNMLTDPDNPVIMPILAFCGMIFMLICYVGLIVIGVKVVNAEQVGIINSWFQWIVVGICNVALSKLPEFLYKSIGKLGIFRITICPIALAFCILLMCVASVEMIAFMFR